MAEQLEIVDVQIGAPRAAEQFAAGEQRVDVSIKVRNRSKKTVHAVSSVRGLSYDPDTRTLFVGLREVELPPEIRPSNFVRPRMTAVAPGRSETLKVSVPLVIHELVPSGGLGMGVKDLDISGMESVRCEVGFSDTPFYPKLTDPPAEMRRQFRSSTQSVERTLPRTLPQR
jgi:hypothetical protein